MFTWCWTSKALKTSCLGLTWPPQTVSRMKEGVVVDVLVAGGCCSFQPQPPLGFSSERKMFLFGQSNMVSPCGQCECKQAAHLWNLNHGLTGWNKQRRIKKRNVSQSLCSVPQTLRRPLLTCRRVRATGKCVMVPHSGSVTHRFDSLILARKTGWVVMHGMNYYWGEFYLQMRSDKTNWGFLWRVLGWPKYNVVFEVYWILLHHDVGCTVCFSPPWI